MIGPAAAPAQAAPAAEGPVAAPMYWSYACDYGRACLRHRIPVENSYLNLEHCGDNPVHDYYDWGRAQGNPFVVFYKDGRWDFVNAWSQRTLDGTNLAVVVHVYC
ncbi:hypothetical protein [Virgisporangium aurantiacum]|uniref:Uncharacterized protein n=1 Tax=Virgisporangium aurantiacum TaxID=175570 RepID=A0A8J3ZH49_9ACTN|nr:hypothetical protein [Virgisporangium aurantiacum]GIJ61490.1 hypothetical protein Vau01_090060 [Virgisporangium aurantiacum]